MTVPVNLLWQFSGTASHRLRVLYGITELQNVAYPGRIYPAGVLFGDLSSVGCRVQRRVDRLVSWEQVADLQRRGRSPCPRTRSEQHSGRWWIVS
jgi:hypothetical protein